MSLGLDLDALAGVRVGELACRHKFAAASRFL